MAHATCQEAATEDKENIGEDRAEHAGLDNANFTILESYNADLRSSVINNRPTCCNVSYNQLDSISKCRIEQPTQSLTELD